MIRSHTGALAGNTEILRAFLRRCGIVQADSYDQFVETIELFANAPFDDDARRRGHCGVGQRRLGGGRRRRARRDAGMTLATLDAATSDELRAILPEFGSVTNPIDATGAIYDDPTLLPTLFEAIFAEPGRPIIAATVNVAPVGTGLRRLAGTIADAARTSGRTFVAFQSSPLRSARRGDRADAAFGQRSVAARHPERDGALKHLPQRREFWAARCACRCYEQAERRRRSCAPAIDAAGFSDGAPGAGGGGIPVVDAALARSAQEAVAICAALRQPVALKAEAPGLLHKSDLGCVQLNCATEREVVGGYEAVVANARRRASRPPACWCSRW